MPRFNRVSPHGSSGAASTAQQVSELTAEREAVGRRTAGNDGQPQAQQFMLSEVGLPDELKAPVLCEDAVKTMAGTVARPGVK